ncbi:MAG: peptidoglycan DD-metalloendopeptidase family protein [Clostridia bacterium]|nr:peptidoglycan DD-metalloendopeptidase family protein [Clostridia bacterium]
MDNEEVSEKKQETAARIIYIVLAVIITVTMIVSVVSAVNRRKQKSTPVPAETAPEATSPVTSAETASLPHIIKPRPQDTGEAAPQTTAPANEPPETTEKTEPAAVERIYVVPVNGYVIKDFTMDMPVWSVTMSDYRVHNGMDIAADVGSPVYAFTDGQISKIYTDPMMGQTVEIDHGDGIVSVCRNLQFSLPEGVTVGAQVRAGDVIGAVGETALIECAEVPHLHFSIMKNGEYEMPSDYIGSIQYFEE